jgi:aminoglycoside phosphotransferase (APT) family kinase protein
MGPDLAAGAARSLQALGCAADLDWTAQTLTQSADHRWVVLYRFHDRAGRCLASAVAKTYPDDEGAGTYAAMRALAALVARSGRTELLVPEALCWDPTLRLLVMETVAGTSYRDIARDPGSADRLKLAGEALAVLHSLPVPDGWRVPGGLAAHAAEICRPDPCALLRARPADARRIESVYAAALAGESVGVAPAPLHRDLHLGQLVARGDGVAVLDWDLHAAGDPALDVANLLVYLETRLGDGAVAMQEAVRSGYARRGDVSVLGRLAAYEALTYLRMAAKRHRLGDSGGPLGVGDLLTLAESKLS